MERKTLLTNLIVLAVMVVGIGVAVFFLYRNVGVSPSQEDVAGTEYDLTFPGAGDSAAQLAEVTEETVPAPEEYHETESQEKVAEAVTAAVNVPEGPFKVKNSKTGRINLFSQTKDHSLILTDKGKTLWLTSFHEPICGKVRTIDYFANGNLQFVFCAGDQLYLIDRLGRFVKGFPKKLDKEVLLGPDVYDFNGQKVYNVLVLHKDNTVQMYNMKGQKPASWKGLTSHDTVLGLPERLEVGGRTFWVLETAAEKLIFPFYGGNPVVTSAKISRASQVHILNSTSVQVSDPDGNKMTVKLR